MSVEHEVQPRRVTAGVDWASEDHVVAVVDDQGVVVQRFGVTHTAPELRRMICRLQRAGVVEVAIERPDGPVVEALLDGGVDGVRDRPAADQEHARTLRISRQHITSTATTASTPTC